MSGRDKKNKKQIIGDLKKTINELLELNNKARIALEGVVAENKKLQEEIMRLTKEACMDK